MRRLWAHILLAVTALVLVGTTFVSVLTQANANIEFKNGYDMVFRVSNKNDAGSKTDEPFENDEAVSEIAEIMEDRLKTSGISNYRIAKQGYDTIKVSLAQQNQDDYYMVIRYLSFNGALALTNAQDDYALGSDFLNGKATLEQKNGYPVISIPVNKENSDYTALLEATRQMQEDGANGGETVQTDEDGNTQTNYYIYLWYDYLKDYDTFSQTSQDSENYNEEVANKIFVKFNIDELNVLQASDSDDFENYISTVLNVDTDGDGKITVAEVRNAYNYGRFYVNLLNASSLDYKVELIYTKTSPAWGEEIFALSDHPGLAWSKTFVATLVAVLIISLIMIAYFKLGALSVGTTTILSCFAGTAAIVLVSSEFNVAGLVGLVALAIASLTSGIIYLTKLKDEAYRGRSLKKANTEAAKKSVLPIVDVNVILIIVGVFSYVFGGALLRTFAAVAVIGGLASLILNTLWLRGLMWLATNATSLQGRYDIFGIENDKVPNLMKEEKQTYYGPYAEKDFSKNKKVYGIASIVLAVACLAGVVTFGILGKGQVYESGSGVLASEIYIETTDEHSGLNLKEVQSIIDNLKVTEGTKEVEFKEYVVKDGTDYHTIAFLEEGVNVNHYYYTVQLNKSLTGEETASYSDGTISETGTLRVVLENVVAAKNFDDSTSVDLKATKITSNYEPKFLGILWGTLVSIATITLYLLARYRLSRGLTAGIFATVVGTITAGIFALLRLAVGAYVALALPVAVAFAFMVAVIWMNKERELVLDDKTRNDSVDNRNAIMVKANGIAFYPISVVTLLAAYLAVDYLAFGAAFSAWVFMAIAIGCGLSCLFVSKFFGGFAQFFYAKFRTAPSGEKKKKSKKVVKQNKSAEPEEAVFIGINDF